METSQMNKSESIKNNEYIALYLSVRGELKVGDKYKLAGNPYDVFEAKEHCLDLGEGSTRKIKHQLFLCSTNVEIGDKVRCSKRSNKEIIIEEIEKKNGDNYFPKGIIVWNREEVEGNIRFWRPIEEVFKVIGLISTDAKWVKEGDKFKEDEVEIPNGEVPIFKNVPNPIKIKCRCCGTYK